LLEGNEALFRGLSVHDNWDWSKSYPVLQIDFAGGASSTPEDFHRKMEALFIQYGDVYNYSFRNSGSSNKLDELILHVARSTGSRVVLLIDEYDKPILENIENPDKAALMREELRFWYNGYNFMGEPVYNPFDILLFLGQGKFYRNYWFETGSPSFLIKLFQKNSYFLPNFESIQAGEELLSSFDLDRIEPVTLLFQSGYLTIDHVEFKLGAMQYTLRIPNHEVKTALSSSLFSAWSGQAEQRIPYQNEAWEALQTADLPRLEKVIRRLFAGVPWRNFTNNDLADFEGYYASVL
jgi:hypothetical protein